MKKILQFNLKILYKKVFTNNSHKIQKYRSK